MTSYRFGDVVLVPFPFTDQSATKKRPAVVVSSVAYRTDHINLILMGISSQFGATPTGRGDRDRLEEGRTDRTFSRESRDDNH